MGAEVDFNALQFEKKLTNLKDSQDSINATCSWCLEHKQHHKRIVATWLSVLKRVKVEQRLTLFYLANDVIQYSKRKSFDFVESWGTALQKATTLVRDVKVKHKILRIFKIWEQRGVYGEEFISDLSGLISVSPSAKKVDENVDFPSAHLANKIRICTKLDNETDRKLQLFKQHNPQLQDGEALMASLKDRAHVDDVEKEMDEYVRHLESYIEALRTEIKARNSFINLLNATDAQLEKDRKDVKVVASAYRSFATRVKNFRKKLEEKKTSLNSPIPSPDINAPSPSPDSELDLPDYEKSGANSTGSDAYRDAGFYQPTDIGQDTFMNNGFTSFLGSGVNFSLNSDAAGASKTQANQLATFFANVAEPPPPPAPVPAPAAATATYNNYNNNQMPLAPPPLPPFTNEVYSDYSGPSYGNNGSYADAGADSYQNFSSDAYAQGLSASYSNDAYKCDAYNPEEDVETWSTSEWAASAGNALQTPASPPPMEKEAFLPPIEYHEEPAVPGAVDVDHRLLLGAPDKKDIDHRNLISLTGSPKAERAGAAPEKRTDWRPNSHGFARPGSEFRHDNNESIDMELSDDEAQASGEPRALADKPATNPKKKGLLPPPPFPANMDANSFLEELDEAQYDELREGTAPWRRGGKAPLLADRPPRLPRRGGRMGHMGHMASSRGEFHSRGDFREPNMRARFRGAGKFPPRGSIWTRGARGGRAFGTGYHKNY